RAEIFGKQPAIAAEQASDNHAIDLWIFQADLGQPGEGERIFVSRPGYIDRIGRGCARGHEFAQRLLGFSAENGDVQASARRSVPAGYAAAAAIADDSDAG